MKKWLVILVCTIFTLLGTSAYGQTGTPLGTAHVGFKVDYLSFTDSDTEDLDADSDVYFGVDGYFNVSPNFYIGGEIGYAETDGSESEVIFGVGTVSIDTEIEYLPIEVNAKYVIQSGENLTIGFGGGLSYNSVDFEIKGTALGLTIKDSDDEWLLGGQLFAEVNYSIDNFFIGANVKYQLTEDFDDIKIFGVNAGDLNFSNFRVGGHVGMTF